MALGFEFDSALFYRWATEGKFGYVFVPNTRKPELASQQFYYKIVQQDVFFTVRKIHLIRPQSNLNYFEMYTPYASDEWC